MSTSPLPLLAGRHAERERAQDAIGAAISGRGGRTLLVAGEAGIGKTSFLDAVERDAEDAGMRVFVAAATGRSEGSPYSVAQALLDSAFTNADESLIRSVFTEDEVFATRQVLGLDPPSGTRQDPASQRHLIRAAMVKAVNAVSRVQPTLILVDDLQLADTETVRVLSHAAQELVGAPLVLCFGYRPEKIASRRELHTSLGRLKMAAGEVIELDPLDVDGVNELVAAHYGTRRIPTPLAASIRDVTGGVPFNVIETIYLFAEQGRSLREVARLAAAGQLPTPSTVEDLVLERASSMTETQRLVTDALAIAGEACTPDVLATVIDLPVAEVASALTELEDRHITSNDGGRWTLSHAQLATVMLQVMHADTAQALHSRFAVAFADLDQALVAHHASAAGDSRKAARAWAEAARSSVARRGPLSAHAQYQRAVEELQRAGVYDPALEWEIRYEHEYVLASLGYGDQREATLDRMWELAQGDTEREVKTMPRMAHCQMRRGGSPDEASALAMEAANRARQMGDAENEAEALLTYVDAMLPAASDAHGDLSPHRLVEVCEMALATVVDARQHVRALVQYGSTLTLIREFGKAERLANEALELSRANHWSDAQAHAEMVLFFVAQEGAGDPKAALSHLERAQAAFIAAGEMTGYAKATVNLATALFFAGKASEAIEAHTRIIDLIDDDQSHILAHSLLNRAHISLSVLGDVEVAERDAQKAWRWFESSGHHREVAACLTTLADAALMRQDFAAAREHIDRGMLSSARADDGRQDHQLWAAQAAYKEAAECDVAGALEASQAAVQAAERSEPELFLSSALAQQARLWLLRGETDQAVEVARQAVKSLTDSSDRPWRAYFVLFLALQAAGEPVAAWDALCEANDRVVAMLESLAPPQRAKAANHHLPLAIRSEYQALSRRFWRLPAEACGTSDDIVIDLGDNLPDADIAYRRTQVRAADAELARLGVDLSSADLGRLLGVSPATVRADRRALASRPGPDR